MCCKRHKKSTHKNTDKGLPTMEEESRTGILPFAFRHLYILWVVHFQLLTPVGLFCDPMNCSPPGSSVHGILQARTLEWVAISFSRWLSQPRNQTGVSYISCIARRFFTMSYQGSILWDIHAIFKSYTLNILSVQGWGQVHDPCISSSWVCFQWGCYCVYKVYIP